MASILIHSNGVHVGTGYGVQTELLCRWLLAHYHDVINSAFYGLQGAALNLGGLKILPGGYDGYGNDILHEHYAHHQPDMLLTLMDVWVLNDEVLKAIPAACWIPVDHDPIPPAVAHKLQFVKYPIAMSRFGQKEMARVGVKAFYLPHAVDAEIYKPGDRLAARQALGIPEGVFVAVVVAANKGFPSRKNLPQIFKAWSQFIKENPDAILCVHSEPRGIHSGLDLLDLCKFYGLTPKNVKFPNEYGLKTGGYSPMYLNQLYNAADVKLSPSAGEGFGVTDLEAQAAGCPVIVSDFTAQAELGEVGYKIPVTDDDKEYTLQESEQVDIKPSAIVTALAWAKANQGDQALRDRAREFAMQYEYNHVFTEYFTPILEKVLADQKPPAVRKLKRGVPDVSVIFPVLNASGYPLFDKAIESTLAQEGVNVEIIAVDDGSTDDTWARLQAWAEKDSRVKPVRHDVNKGGSEASNTAAAQAKGRYFIIQSARSWYEQGSFKAFVRALDNNPSVGFVYGATQYHGASNQRHIPPALYDQAEFMRSFVSLFGYMYRREAWDKGCRYKWYLHVEDKYLCVGDRHIQMEMITKLGYKGLALPQVLALNYFYSGQGQMDTLLKKYQAEMDAKWRENFPMAVSGA